MSVVFEYSLVRSQRKTITIQIKDGRIILRGPMSITKEQADTVIEKNTSWILKQLEKQREDMELTGTDKLTREQIEELVDKACSVIPERVSLYAKKIGVTYGKITIRCQRTRWGSCSGKGNLSFNCMLMMMPMEVVDSVVVHELCHRKEMNHSERFYNEIYKVYPEYEKWNRWLKEKGGYYMRLIPNQ